MKIYVVMHLGKSGIESYPTAVFNNSYDAYRLVAKGENLSVYEMNLNENSTLFSFDEVLEDTREDKMLVQHIGDTSNLFKIEETEKNKLKLMMYTPEGFKENTHDKEYLDIYRWSIFDPKELKTYTKEDDDNV